MPPPVALFDSWGGHFSDNPRAVSEAMHRRGVDVRQCWVLADGVDGPAWAERVAPGSAAHLARLGEARYVVANHLMPPFEKAPGATVVQTWHGVPLKRIGFDLRDADRRHLEHIARERAAWDLLLSPGPAATPRLRSAFRYEGPVLESGYPRNDLLGVAAERDRARRALGLADGARAVLYAPTFRTGGRFDLRLDPAALAEALDAHILLRLHHFAPSAAHAAHPRVRDVTRRPDDIRDLLLAADALVTDYSSVMADFALTGRPMVFFADDLEHYRDRLHGFYDDYESTVPGPVVTSTESVAEALADPGLEARWRDRYVAFRHRFGPVGDGAAADRVVDAIMRWREAGEAGAGGRGGGRRGGSPARGRRG